MKECTGEEERIVKAEVMERGRGTWTRRRTRAERGTGVRGRTDEGRKGEGVMEVDRE